MGFRIGRCNLLNRLKLWNTSYLRLSPQNISISIKQIDNFFGVGLNIHMLANFCQRITTIVK